MRLKTSNMVTSLDIAEALIHAQKRLLDLHYKYDGKVPDNAVKRFDRLETEVRNLSQLCKKWNKRSAKTSSRK
jgi:hypothetical protein